MRKKVVMEKGKDEEWEGKERGRRNQLSCCCLENNQTV